MKKNSILLIITMLLFITIQSKKLTKEEQQELERIALIRIAEEVEIEEEYSIYIEKKEIYTERTKEEINNFFKKKYEKEVNWYELGVIDYNRKRGNLEFSIMSVRKEKWGKVTIGVNVRLNEYEGTYYKVTLIKEKRNWKINSVIDDTEPRIKY